MRHTSANWSIVKDSSLSSSPQRMAVAGMFPRLGPQSGGTLVTLTGSNLDIGSNLAVTLGGQPCHVTSRAANVTCVTSPSQRASEGNKVVVTLDGATRILNERYEYTQGKMTI